MLQSQSFDEAARDAIQNDQGKDLAMTQSSEDLFRITLLGTGAPPPRMDRFGPSTLVEVGDQKFIFDAGRGAMQRLHQLGIPFAEINGMFLTHHHSDHVSAFPIFG